jgi:hypothetical protein
MIEMLIRLNILQAQIKLQRGLQEAYDNQQRAIEQAAHYKDLGDAIDRENYGRNAIDVEVREVPDVLLIEKDKP